MHEKIMRFPSDELYESKLMAADFVRERLLKVRVNVVVESGVRKSIHTWSDEEPSHGLFARGSSTSEHAPRSVRRSAFRFLVDFGLGSGRMYSTTCCSFVLPTKRHEEAQRRRPSPSCAHVIGLRVRGTRPPTTPDVWHCVGCVAPRGYAATRCMGLRDQPNTKAWS